MRPADTNYARPEWADVWIGLIQERGAEGSDRGKFSRRFVSNVKTTIEAVKPGGV